MCVQRPEWRWLLRERARARSCLPETEAVVASLQHASGSVVARIGSPRFCILLPTIRVKGSKTKFLSGGPEWMPLAQLSEIAVWRELNEAPHTFLLRNAQPHEFRNSGVAVTGLVKSSLLSGSSLVAVAALLLSINSPAQAACSPEEPSQQADKSFAPKSRSSRMFRRLRWKMATTLFLEQRHSKRLDLRQRRSRYFQPEWGDCGGYAIGGESSTDILGDPSRDPQPNHIDTFNLTAGT